MSFMEQAIITYPGITGSIKTVGIIVVEATVDFSWIGVGARFDDDMLDQMERSGMDLTLLVMREPTDDERISASVITC